MIMLFFFLVIDFVGKSWKSVEAKDELWPLLDTISGNFCGENWEILANRILGINKLVQWDIRHQRIEPREKSYHALSHWYKNDETNVRTVDFLKLVLQSLDDPYISPDSVDLLTLLDNLGHRIEEILGITANDSYGCELCNPSQNQ